MRIGFLAKEAIGALRSNFMRSALTVVGIVVGIFSVTSMLAIGEGVSQGVLDKFSAFGSGDISIQGDLLIDDYSWLSEQKYIDNIIASASVSRVTVLVGETEYSPTVNAVIGDFSGMKSFKVLSGEIYDFYDYDLDEKIVILSEDFTDSIADDGTILSIGDSIRISGKYFTIAALTDLSSGFGRGDGDIYIPYQTMKKNLSSDSYFSEMSLLLKDQDSYEVVSSHILTTLNTKRGLSADNEDSISVASASDFIESAQETTDMLNLFLAIVGGIALFVGGIGTMNMMLTTVSERTKEIGLRKAIGAHDRDILIQILIESILMTFIGGVIGIALTYVGSIIANSILSDDSVIQVIMSFDVMLTAVIVSILVGVIFGYYPAKNAAKLQPVEALRSD